MTWDRLCVTWDRPCVTWARLCVTWDGLRDPLSNCNPVRVTLCTPF